MNRQMINLSEEIKNKKAEMQAFIEGKDIVNAKKIKEEIELLNADYFLAEQEFDLDKEEVESTGKPKENKENKEKKEFFNLVRNPQMQNNMVSSDDKKGGYTVPHDIQTKVNKLLEADDHLFQFIRVTPVTAPSGARTFRKRNSGYIHQATSVAELAKIKLNQTPQFGRIEYKVEKFADRYLASNEVLDDTDANLEAEMTDWLVDVSRMTRNNVVRVVLNSETMTDAFDGTIQREVVKSTNDIKKVANVKLNKAFQTRMVYITNQDGFNELDTLQYPDGRYVLQESITNPSQKILFGKLLHVVSNDDLPSIDSKAPLLCGDLKEGVEAFVREGLQVRTSDLAGDAWINDGVEWRAIERLDCCLRDAEAFIYCTFDIDEGLTVTPMTATELAEAELFDKQKEEIASLKSEIAMLKKAKTKSNAKEIATE